MFTAHLLHSHSICTKMSELPFKKLTPSAIKTKILLVGRENTWNNILLINHIKLLTKCILEDTHLLARCT